MHGHEIALALAKSIHIEQSQKTFKGAWGTPQQAKNGSEIGLSRPISSRLRFVISQDPALLLGKTGYGKPVNLLQVNL